MLFSNFIESVIKKWGIFKNLEEPFYEFRNNGLHAHCFFLILKIIFAFSFLSGIKEGLLPRIIEICLVIIVCYHLYPMGILVI